MNEPMAVIVYFAAIFATIAYTALVGHLVQRQHNPSPGRGCAAMAASVVLTAFLAWLVFLGLRAIG